MKQLLKDLEKCRRYGREELIALLRRWKKNHDLEARNQVIEGVMPMVVGIAKRYQASGIELSELVSMGVEGVIKAADKFDPERGFAFTTYAVWWIQQVIRRYINQERSTIRLPNYVIRKTGGKSVPVEPLLNYDVPDALLTLDGTDKKLDRSAVVENVRTAITALPTREREIVKLRMRGATLKEIGERVGVTRERIRQVEMAAHARLRGWLTREGLTKMDKTLNEMGLLELVDQVSSSDLHRLRTFVEQEFKAATNLYNRRIAFINTLADQIGSASSKGQTGKESADSFGIDKVDRRRLAKTPTRDMITDLLRQRQVPMRTADMARGLSLPYKQVACALSYYKELFCKAGDGLWTLRSDGSGPNGEKRSA